MTARFLEWLLLILSLNACTGLYEDQIGKFEWRQQYVGKLKFSHLDIFSPIKKVIIASEQNVISALSLKSGEILWRQILEQDESNSIQFMSVDNDITTISGNNFPLVRGWDLENGHLMWEWGISKENEHTKWFSINQKLYQIDFYKHSEIELTVYQSSSGKKLRFEKIPAAWLEPEKCVLQNDILACVTSDKLIYSVKFVNSAGEIDIKVQHKSLLDLFKEEVSGVLKTTEGPLSIVTVNAGGNNKAISLHPEITVLKTTEMKNQLLATANVEQQKLIAAVSLQNEVLDVKTVDIDGETLPELSNQLNYPDINGKPEFVLFVCQPRRDRGIACRILISTSHHVLLLLQHPGKILWTREESLASVVTAEMIDLPVSDTDAAIEKEFDSKDCGFIGMFFRRIISQSVQLQNLFLTVMGLRRTTSTDDKESLIRDEFGLHKLIVAATSPGKIYGIDNLTGKIVWQIKIDDIEPYHSIKPTLPFFELRTARHAPYPAKCAILAKHKITQEGVLIIFNPITGQLEDNTKKLIKLGFKVKQSLLLHEVDEEFSKGILFLDDENNVHVYPDSSKSIAISLAPSTFIFTADASTGILEGYSLALSTKDKLISTRMWQIRLGQGSDKIISVLAKNNLERVHSQGRVLGDRSVLYKYVNPNLVSVITQGYHPSHKTILNLHLVDVVSGNIVFSATHRRAKEPVHVVHSENWLVYTYFNEKYRRTELASLEMYEGKTQSNATAFSSVDSASLLPIVERQAYIFPANVLALKETITEKGITSKHILVGLANGGILELPWVYADPRRPITVTPEMREEGVIPYMPELPIPLEAIINHNQTVANVRGIHTSSSGLESTCLVFAYGLDIFYTRVAPSKTFDLLKDDFDYYLITTVLLALAAASYITKKLSSRKALKQAWK